MAPALSDNQLLERIDQCFPFKDSQGEPSYYPYQREAIAEAIEAYLQGISYVILDGGTGTGKTAVAHTIANYFGEGAWGITLKNVLVKQYEALNWRTLMGAVNFKCKRCATHNCHQGTALARARGEIDKSTIGCTNGCPYAEASREFFEPTDLSGCMTNAYYMWYGYRRFLKLPPKGLFVADEAHLLEATLADMLKVTITRDDMRAVGFSERLTSADEKDGWLSRYCAEVRQAHDEVEEQLAKLSRKLARGHPAFRDALRQLEAYRKQLQAVDWYSQYKCETRWLTHLDADDGHVERLVLEPVYGGFLAERLFRLATRVLLMSATFLDKHHTSTELRMPENKVRYIKVPSYFPPENQPLFWDPSLRPNYENFERVLPALVGKLDRVLEHHAEERGIIHSVSHQLTKAIVAHSRYAARFTLVGEGQKQTDAINRHLKTRASVLLGPAFVEGLDLAGDTGSFVIWPKVPFKPVRGDKKLEIREQDHPGYSWLLTARDLVQGKGRVIRSKDEVVSAYCLDGNLALLVGPTSPYRQFFPDLFLSSIFVCKL